MSDLEKMIMDEIESLTEMRQIDVLGFIRYLKMEKPVRQQWITEWFEHALVSIHRRADELQITPADIRAQTVRRHKIDSPNG